MSLFPRLCLRANDFLNTYKYLCAFGLALIFALSCLGLLAQISRNGRYAAVNPETVILDSRTGLYYLPAHISSQRRLQPITELSPR